MGNGKRTVAQVRNPVTVDDGNEKFTNYEIHTESMDGSCVALESTVQRRYSEFAWLATYLHKTAGLDRKKLPPKKLFGRFDESFIRSRCEGLQEFITAVVQDEAFCNREAVYLFLHTKKTVAEIATMLHNGDTIISPSVDSVSSGTVIRSKDD